MSVFDIGSLLQIFRPPPLGPPGEGLSFGQAAAREGMKGASQGGLFELLGQSRHDLSQIPGIESIFAQLAQLQEERQGLNQITSASPEVQALARQAAFAPLEGLRTSLDSALLQAANSASGRGLGRGSISAALQAQAVPQIMEPAMARAQGLESQLLLDIPFRERAFGLESLGAGQNILGQLMQQRQMPFANLAQALESTMQERQHDFQKKQARGGAGRLIGGLLGAGLGAFTGGIGAGVGGFLGNKLFGGNPRGGGDQTVSQGNPYEGGWNFA